MRAGAGSAKAAAGKPKVAQAALPAHMRAEAQGGTEASTPATSTGEGRPLRDALPRSPSPPPPLRKLAITHLHPFLLQSHSPSFTAVRNTPLKSLCGCGLWLVPEGCDRSAARLSVCRVASPMVLLLQVATAGRRPSATAGVPRSRAGSSARRRRQRRWCPPRLTSTCPPPRAASSSPMLVPNEFHGEL